MSDDLIHDEIRNENAERVHILLLDAERLEGEAKRLLARAEANRKMASRICPESR